MKTEELKNSICQKINMLDDKELIEINGIIINYLNQKDNDEEWNKLTEAQKTGLYEAIESVKKGEGILHDDIMNKYRSKYSGK